MKTLGKKKLIVINLFLIVALLTTTVSAWFLSSYNNSVYSNEVTVSADGALELSTTNNSNDFHSSVNLSDYAWFKNCTFTDVTGQGNGDFLRPALTQMPDYATVNTSGTWTAATVSSNTAEGQYVKFTLYMRSTDPLKVYLGAGSAVKPSVGMNSLLNSTTRTYSTDIITGALRLSCCNTGTKTRKFTWIPRPEIFVSDSAANRAVQYSDISVNKSSGASFTHKYYNSSKTLVSSTTNTITKDITDATRQLLATLSKTNASDKYYTGKCDFYIWVEGTDNEARRAFVNGKFVVDLNLEAEDSSVAS